ncbi:MAG: AraC family transcriptional regulator [Myxococcota bacterium]
MEAFPPAPPVEELVQKGWIQPIGPPRRVGASALTFVEHATPVGVWRCPPSCELTVGLVIEGIATLELHSVSGTIRTVVATPGLLVVNTPGLEHRFDADRPLRWLLTAIPKEALTRFGKSYGDERLRLLRARAENCAPLRDPLCRGLLLRMKHAAHADPPVVDATVDALLAGLAVAEIGRKGIALRGPCLHRVLELVEQQLTGRVRLDDLAAAAGLSKAHFGRAFKAAIGVSPSRYVVDRRVARARQLLVSGELSLSHIAMSCGFSSQSHFTVAFRERVGMTPGAYRRESGVRSTDVPRQDGGLDS